jgi:predicted nucleic acid-binding protein
MTFFNSRGHHAKAVQVGNNLLRSSSVQLIHVDEGLFDEGWTYLQRHQDKDYSLTDSISFIAALRQLVAKRARISASIVYCMKRTPSSAAR